KLEFEDNRSAAGNFREHHVIRKFDQLANDKLEKFSHLSEANHESAFAQSLRRDRWHTNKHEFSFANVHLLRATSSAHLQRVQILSAEDDEHYLCAERL